MFRAWLEGVFSTSFHDSSSYMSKANGPSSLEQCLPLIKARYLMKSVPNRWHSCGFFTTEWKIFPFFSNLKGSRDCLFCHLGRYQAFHCSVLCREQMIEDSFIKCFKICWCKRLHWESDNFWGYTGRLCSRIGDWNWNLLPVQWKFAVMLGAGT